MPEESTTPDLVELPRSFAEAAKRRDFDAMLSPFVPDAVWEAAPLGVSFEGVAAIRGFLKTGSAPMKSSRWSRSRFLASATGSGLRC
jgi:ketosteroid isomerase-like protein